MAQPEDPQARDLLRFMSTTPEVKKKLEKQVSYDYRAAVPELSIMPGVAQSAPDAYGFVDRRVPTTIFINPQKDPSVYPQLLSHEFEHVLQNKVAERYDTSYDTQVLNEMQRMTGGTRTAARDEIMGALLKSGTSTKLQQHLTSKYGVNPSAYIGGMPKGSADVSESFAELSSLEQQINKDLTQDPIVQQEFFNNSPAMMAVYKGTTGLRSNRLDAKDLPPMTAQPATSTPAKSTKPPKRIMDMSVLEIVESLFGPLSDSPQKR